MKITENDLKIVTSTISHIFNVKLHDWYYIDTVHQLDYKYELVIVDNNHTHNEYRVIINTDDNCIIFQYIDTESCNIIDLNTYIIDNSTFIDILDNIVVLIISVLNYYMNILKYSYESEW